MPRPNSVPSYRCKLSCTGRKLACVTLKDVATHERRDVYLGDFGTSESRSKYARVIAEWEGAGRRLRSRSEPVGAQGPTVSQLLIEFYEAHRHTEDFILVIKLLRQLAGPLPVEDFTPSMLNTVRTAMITGAPGRKPWARKHINRQVSRIRQIFKWGVGYQIVPPAILQALQAVGPLKPGQSSAREVDPIGPVAESVVAATIPHLPQPLQVMVKLLELTGMRVGEACVMRTCDLNTTGKIWRYRPSSHKTAHLGKRRDVWIGPAGQELLEPMLRTNLAEYVFRPDEAVQAIREQRSKARKTPLSCGNRPGTHRVETPQRQPGERYTPHAVGVAVKRACDLADRAARQAGEEPVPRWHVHQLRHSAASRIEKQFGLLASSIVLGHSSAKITEAVYVARDSHVAQEVAGAMG